MVNRTCWDTYELDVDLSPGYFKQLDPGAFLKLIFYFQFL